MNNQKKNLVDGLSLPEVPLTLFTIRKNLNLVEFYFISSFFSRGFYLKIDLFTRGTSHSTATEMTKYGCP